MDGRHQKKLTEEQIQRAVVALQNGATLVDLAARFGVDRVTLQRRTGITPRQAQRLTPEQVKRAIAALEDGQSFTAVAARFGIGIRTLEKVTGLKARGNKGTGLSIQNGACYAR